MEEVQELPVKPTSPPENVPNKVGGKADNSANWRTKKSAPEEKEKPSEQVVERPFKAVPALSRKSIPEERVQREEPSEVNKGSNNHKAPEFRRVSQADEEVNVEEVAQKAMGAEISLSMQDLMALSPQLRSELLQRFKKRKVPVLMDEVVDKEVTKEDFIWAKQLPQAVKVYMAQELPSYERLNVPDNGLVISDPILQYHQSLSPGETPKKIYVSKESQSLRTVYPKINGVAEEECVCDMGSQIISMSDRTAKELQLIYDPDITIYMQSANGQSDRTLGVARNVPFKFSSITVYLQVHIVKDPAYKVLLGRPFDVLTSSVIANFGDGSATITITCPNTKQRITMNTYVRGEPRAKPDQDPTISGFQTSRN